MSHKGEPQTLPTHLESPAPPSVEGILLSCALSGLVLLDPSSAPATEVEFAIGLACWCRSEWGMPRLQGPCRGGKAPGCLLTTVDCFSSRDAGPILW